MSSPKYNRNIRLEVLLKIFAHYQKKAHSQQENTQRGKLGMAIFDDLHPWLSAELVVC